MGIAAGFYGRIIFAFNKDGIEKTVDILSNTLPVYHEIFKVFYQKVSLG